MNKNKNHKKKLNKMSYLAKQKLIYYKKYKVDIWGYFKNTLQVLFDNTIYNAYKLNKHYRFLRNALKKTTWVYFKYKTQYEINKLKKTELMAEKKEIFESHLKSRRILVMKLLSLNNLLNRFMKTTISKRLSKVVNIFVVKAFEQAKIFFRRPFIYEVRIPAAQQRRRRIKPQFISFRVIRLFYVIYSYRQLKKIGRKAKSQAGVFEQNYLLIIESKLPSYLYRTALFSTIFDSLDFVKNGNVWINKKYKPLVYYTVKLFDIVGFRVMYKGYILWTIFRRLRRKAFIFLFSRCIYISINFLFTVLISRFTKKDMINSFNFDYYRVVNYAQ